ncbi:hypothetical protein [Filimonas effusa]|uniref:Uncharacterized protein n=1 Tax=Filimonas effusa TaxID=2508721 RepID=A0A4Q1D6N0_9BACT|nr:hypothetical protein [Filimonas effusa]RXK83317.1 hypothetical protein ESB13_14520 [Filimonas effusa]
MRTLRYHLSRTIVFLVAMQIFNLSIDTDHIFHGRLRLGSGHRDDIDSFVEMIVEGITGNHSLFPESHGEDQHSFNKLTQKIVCDNIRNLYPTIKTPDKPINMTSEPDRGCQFISNDFSALFCPPPDLV